MKDTDPLKNLPGDFEEAERRAGDPKHCVACGRDRLKGEGKVLRRPGRPDMWVCNACRSGREGHRPQQRRNYKERTF